MVAFRRAVVTALSSRPLSSSPRLEFSESQRRLIPSLDAATWRRLERAAAELLEWNAKINVISRKDLTASTLIERHYLPSLSLLNVDGLRESLRAGARVIDVGTGGGFPGLPLAIACPESHFTLADGRGKKIKVVRECARVGGTTNVRSLQARVPEDLDDETFDFVLGRSVAALPAFLRSVAPTLRQKQNSESFSGGGVIYIKGGDFQEELTDFRPSHDLSISHLLGDALSDTGDIIAHDKRLLFFPSQALITDIATADKATAASKQRPSSSRRPSPPPRQQQKQQSQDRKGPHPKKENKKQQGGGGESYYSY